jgi:hypothetical protein
MTLDPDEPQVPRRRWVAFTLAVLIVSALAATAVLSTLLTLG